MVLADTVQLLLETVGLDFTRSESLLSVTVLLLLPLSLIKSLGGLALSSLIGTMGMLSIALVICIRYFDGSYDIESDGRFIKDLPDNLKPSFGSVGATGAFSPQVFILICMLLESFVAHFVAPRFYAELKDNTVPRLTAVAFYSFGASAMIFVVVTVFGFLTFGSNCDGYILNNYSTNDPLATFCRLAVAIGLVFTHPLTFIGVRGEFSCGVVAMVVLTHSVVPTTVWGRILIAGKANLLFSLGFERRCS